MSNNLGNLTNGELQALLLAKQNGNLPPGLQFPGGIQSLGGFGNSSMNQSNSGSSSGPSPATDHLRNSVLAQLIQQQAQEEQKRALLNQQLAALGGFQHQQNAMSQQEQLALFLQQKQQQQQLQQQQLQLLQGFGGFSGNSAQASLLGNSQFGGIPGFPNMGGNKLDQAAIARLLQNRNVGQMAQADVSMPPAGLKPASMMNENEALMALSSDPRRKGRTGTFPQKLHQMLSELERQDGGLDIASFLPHGRAFAIHKPRDFVKHVMPKYFRMSRFSSFQRQLNLYDFQRITEGPDKGAYYHELFVQGRPILSTMMKRNKIKGKGIKKDDDEDDNQGRDSPVEDELSAQEESNSEKKEKAEIPVSKSLEVSSENKAEV